MLFFHNPSVVHRGVASTFAIVVLALTILIAINVIASPIVATHDLALDAIGATTVGDVTHLATKVFRRFAKEAFLETSTS